MKRQPASGGVASQRPWILFQVVGIVWGMAAAAGDETFYQERLLFPLQPKHVHSSSVIECPDGSLLCAWFYGSGERTSRDVVIQGARLMEGHPTWSEVFPMADTPGLPDCNPVLFVGPGKELWLFWIAVPGERWEDSLIRYRRAAQYLGEGPPRWDWQDDLFLEPGDRLAEEMSARFHELRPALPGLEDPRGRLFRESMAQLEWAAWDKSKRQRGWMTRCHGVVLPTGRILLPLYSDGYLAGLMAISDDQGRSWRAGGPIIGPALNQPSVVRRRDGTLVAFMREETFPLADDEQWMRRVFLSESRDEGESWSLAVPTDLPNPNTSLEVLSLRDGRWVLVYNDTERGRHTLAMALSEDEGRSWRWRRRLEHRVGGLFHYPSIIQTRDGRLQVTYTFQPGPDAGRSIKHVSLDPEWIRVEDSDPP